MDAALAEFAQVLRQNGVRVSTSELLDAAQAVEVVGVAPREAFRAALQATLVKREQDVAAFDRAFTWFFSGAAGVWDALDKALVHELEAQGLLEGEELARLVAALQRLTPTLVPLAQAVLLGDRAKMASLFRAAALELDFSGMTSSLEAGFYARRLLSGAGMGAARAELRALEGRLAAEGVSVPTVELVSSQLAVALRKVEQAVRSEVSRQAQARLRRAPDDLHGRSIHSLSQAELRAAERAVRRLAERLKSRWTRRRRVRRRGALDMKRTLRRNLPWGGVPMVPAFRARRPERPDVVVLCDVSESVRNTSRLMLLFIHVLQSLFARVRSFAFVSELGELTQELKGLRPEEAIDVAVAGRVISLAGNSNYGRALERFARDHLDSVTRKTTVLVIGDGRNNYNPSGRWALEEIRRKCKRLIWICPEDARSWGFGDSEMLSYAKACHRVASVQTLEDFEGLADALVSL